MRRNCRQAAWEKGEARGRRRSHPAKPHVHTHIPTLTCTRAHMRDQSMCKSGTRTQSHFHTAHTHARTNSKKTKPELALSAIPRLLPLRHTRAPKLGTAASHMHAHTHTHTHTCTNSETSNSHTRPPGTPHLLPLRPARAPKSVTAARRVAPSRIHITSARTHTHTRTDEPAQKQGTRKCTPSTPHLLPLRHAPAPKLGTAASHMAPLARRVLPAHYHCADARHHCRAVLLGNPHLRPLLLFRVV